jgi:tetratricopeptide (TPR) repeat protein
MSLRIRGIWSSVIPGAVLLLVGSVLADDKRPAREILRDDRVRTRVVQSAESQQPAEQCEPRVILRDLRAREGFDALYDEYESFDRFFRFQRRLAEQDLASGGYYHHYYGPFRSPVDDYISLSEYERYRKDWDRHRREMEVRKAHLLTKHEQAVMAGVRLLKQGDYKRAVVALTLAAKLNHGDPACRIHLAQARLARRQYREAGLVLRRGLQLQPKLVYADLHLDDYYKNGDEFDQYADALRKWVQEHDARSEVSFLLGFLEFQLGDFEAAHAAFKRVSRSLPDDTLTRSFLEITKPAGDSVRE